MLQNFVCQSGVPCSNTDLEIRASTQPFPLDELLSTVFYHQVDAWKATLQNSWSQVNCLSITAEVQLPLIQFCLTEYQDRH